jgi:hypothetical protein
MTALTTRLVVQLAATLTDTLDLGNKQALQALKRDFPWSSGTGQDEADRVWTDTRTLTASSSDSLDLAGSLADAFGNVITFARIRALIVAPAVGNANNVIVGGAASNGFITWVGGATHTLTVRPGGLLLLAAPDATAYVVTAGTADQLKITNVSVSVAATYDIALIGASA